ncbi:hypothetical protein [Abyssibacter sp.]|uniref:hypothetical protein n=1 Tax=Abyssibacter sp. TaxID=2320200 RepID=UPI003519C67F
MKDRMAVANNHRQCDAVFARVVRRVLWLLVWAAAPAAQAFDFDRLRDASQADFQAIAEDAANAYQFRQWQHVRPLSGYWGLGAGVASMSSVQHDDAWSRVFGQDTTLLGQIGVAGEMALDSGWSLGAMASAIPDSGYGVLGASIGWAWPVSGMSGWEVAARGAYSSLIGEDDVELDSIGADLALRRRLGTMTVYGNAGWSTSRFDVSFGESSLDAETVNAARLAVGVSRWFGALFLNGEAGIQSDYVNATLSVGFGI